MAEPREAVDPNAIDMQVLDLASQKGTGGVWMTVLTVKRVLRERGFDPDDVLKAIKILEKNKLVEVRCGSASFERRYDFTDTQLSITTDGEDRLRHLRVSVQFNVRLPGAVARELADMARQRGMTGSATAIQYIQEGLRTDRHPGVDFRWTPGGRTPYITGTGVSVWMLYRIWLDHQEDIDAIRKNYPGLKPVQVHAGVAYAKAYLHEMPEGAIGQKPPFAREVKV